MPAQGRPIFRLMSALGGGLLGAGVSLGIWYGLGNFGGISLDAKGSVLIAALITGVLVGFGMRLTSRLSSPGIYVCAAVIAFVTSIFGKYLAVQERIAVETSASYDELRITDRIQPLGRFTADEISEMVRDEYHQIVVLETASIETFDVYNFIASAGAAVLSCLVCSRSVKEQNTNEFVADHSATLH